jgi:hypothetical protein
VPRQSAPDRCRSSSRESSSDVYLTDPEIHAAVLPPPLTAPPEPRVRVHFTRMEVDGHLHECYPLIPMPVARMPVSPG